MHLFSKTILSIHFLSCIWEFSYFCYSFSFPSHSSFSSQRFLLLRTAWAAYSHELFPLRPHQHYWTPSNPTACVELFPKSVLFLKSLQQVSISTKDYNFSSDRDFKFLGSVVSLSSVSTHRVAHIMSAWLLEWSSFLDFYVYGILFRDIIWRFSVLPL